MAVYIDYCPSADNALAIDGHTIVLTVVLAIVLNTVLTIVQCSIYWYS